MWVKQESSWTQIRIKRKYSFRCYFVINDATYRGYMHCMDTIHRALVRTRKRWVKTSVNRKSWYKSTVSVWTQTVCKSWKTWTENVCCLFPVQAVLTTLLQPVSKAIQQVQGFREQNRTSPFFNHLSAVSESVPALGWVAMVRWDRNVLCVCVCVGG